MRRFESRVSLPGEARGEGYGFKVGFGGEEARAISCLSKDPSLRTSPTVAQQ